MRNRERSVILLQPFRICRHLEYFQKLKGRGAFCQFWTGKMEYLSSIYLRNDSKNVKIISENESYLSTKLDVRNLSGKFVRIAVFAGTALICAVFAGLIIAQLIPFPAFSTDYAGDIHYNSDAAVCGALCRNIGDGI